VTRRSKADRSARHSLAQIVLGFEIVVVFLGALVVFGLKALPAGFAFLAGAALIVVMILALILLPRRSAYVLGWVVQLAVVAGGLLITMLFVVGILFPALWTWCMVAGSRLDRSQT
jgi:hypothetical protein